MKREAVPVDTPPAARLKPLVMKREVVKQEGVIIPVTRRRGRATVKKKQRAKKVKTDTELVHLINIVLYFVLRPGKERMPLWWVERSMSMQRQPVLLRSIQGWPLQG